MIAPALTGLAGACCCAVGLRGLVLVRGASSVERRELSEELSAPSVGAGRSGEPSTRSGSAWAEVAGPDG